VSDDGLEEDPGWKFSPRMLLYMVPGYLSYEDRRGGDGHRDGLESIRQVCLTFSVVIILFGVAVAVVVHGSDKAPARPWIVGIAAVTAFCLGAEEVFGRRPLDCANPTSLATTYRSRFFIRTAFSQAIALFAFVGAMTISEWWLYWMFLPFALFGLARNAPTRRHLESAQDQLRADGCRLSLVRVLRELRPRSR
jgi:F0F1-type ATP synthase membrane subunit c/vacuolar-type H+-ATPase subunit K